MKRFEGVCEWLDERCEFFEKRGEEFFQDPYHSFKLCQYRFLLQSSTNMQVLCQEKKRFQHKQEEEEEIVQVGEVGEVEEGGLLQEQKGEEEKEVDFLQEKKEEEEEKEEKKEKVEMEEEEEEEEEEEDSENVDRGNIEISSSVLKPGEKTGKATSVMQPLEQATVNIQL